jgi:hypothetical protein
MGLYARYLLPRLTEGVARPVREFDEPEAFVGVEPLDHPVDWWTGGCLELGWLNRGRVPKARGCEW